MSNTTKNLKKTGKRVRSPSPPHAPSKRTSTQNTEQQDAGSPSDSGLEWLDKDTYKVLAKIGEGTFSCVYKAIDLNQHLYANEWDYQRHEEMRQKLHLKPAPQVQEPSSPPASGDGSVSPTPPRYVAIKRLFATSSPVRISNEIKLLSRLFGHINVAPLITAVRHQDQVALVLPYYAHVDFRELTHMPAELPFYFKQLFRALDHLNRKRVIHRDIKPQNFLYNPSRRLGVLVDFGLAEDAPPPPGTVITAGALPTKRTCACADSIGLQLKRNTVVPAQGFPLHDIRPGRRANRAGTRGLRAPEVLFKCPDQSTKIDLWSAGVMLLCYLTRTFPFFNSTTDVDALMELACIVGRKQMELCGLLHGVVFETNVPTLNKKGIPWEEVVRSQRFGPDTDGTLSEEEMQAVDLLKQLMMLNPSARYSASQALEHPWLKNVALDYEQV